jgi:5'-3' exonuclease
MGVPGLYRWLAERYPKSVADALETMPEFINGTRVDPDTSAPNPNGVEYDNLYLDMNGIIHPACHPEDLPAPSTEEEMYLAIFKYIDRVFNVVRPRKIMYMAVDGVAPRAKVRFMYKVLLCSSRAGIFILHACTTHHRLGHDDCQSFEPCMNASCPSQMNQQRSRRYRSAKEIEDKREEEEKLRNEWSVNGRKVPPKKPPTWDHNVITPGTSFMYRLSVFLRYAPAHSEPSIARKFFQQVHT